jgi:cytochrome c oxidase cbb3-type subunit I/II
MPPWYELPLDDKLAVIQYIKYVLTVDRSDPQKPDYYFVDEPPGPPLYIGTPPPPSANLISHGRDIWRQAKCWECHGDGGKGDGEKAAGLKDDFGFPIRPANLTSGQFKSGSSVTDIFRTISTGLSGTPMPSFLQAFQDADRWALAYYILSLSAFTDPLTTAPLPISAADRAALNNPKLETPTPEQAYGLLQP